LRAAVNAVIRASNDSTDVTQTAVALARRQAPPSDECVSITLDKAAADLDDAAEMGFTLFSGSMAKPKESGPPPAAAVERLQAGSKREVDDETSSLDRIAAKIGAGGNAAKPTGPLATPRSVVADVSNQVQKLPVVYQPPKFLLLRQPVAFKLVIEALGPGSAKGAFNGETIAGHAQISRTVTAALSAPAGVTITPLSPATQTVTDIANPTWLWDVTAETPNAATLELSIASLVTIDGVDHPVPIEVYNAQIPVQLSAIDQIQLWIGQIDPIWKWLIGVITVVGGAIGWALGWRLKLRRGGARPDPA